MILLVTATYDHFLEATTSPSVMPNHRLIKDHVMTPNRPSSGRSSKISRFVKQVCLLITRRTIRVAHYHSRAALRPRFVKTLKARSDEGRSRRVHATWCKYNSNISVRTATYFRMPAPSDEQAWKGEPFKQNRIVGVKAVDRVVIQAQL